MPQNEQQRTGVRRGIKDSSIKTTVYRGILSLARTLFHYRDITPLEKQHAKSNMGGYIVRIANEVQ